MRRRGFLLATGSALLGSSGLGGKPTVGLEFEAVNVEQQDPSSIDSVMVDFKTFELLPQYVDESADASITFILDLEDHNRVSETVESVSLTNGEKTTYSDVQGELPIVKNGVESSDNILTGQIIIRVDHPSVSDSYQELFSITDKQGLFREQINGKNLTVQQDEYGKWVCVLNYEHYGGEQPTVSPGSTFPQLPNGLSTANTVQELGSNGELRHVDNITQYGSWDVDAVRLEAVTSNHNRKIHYFTTDQTAIDAVVDDSQKAGNADLQADTLYADHTANLPSAGEKETDTDSDRLFGYGFPIYQPGEYHWAVGGYNSNRWEVDDYPDDASKDTVHRVWIRLS